MGEKTFKTDLEIELENALEERGCSFMEMKKEQCEKFLKQDAKNYPGLDPQNIADAPTYFSDLEPFLDKMVGKEKYALLKRWETGQLSIADRVRIFTASAVYAMETCNDSEEMQKRGNAMVNLCHLVFDDKNKAYKIKSAIIKNFCLKYEARTDRIDDIAQAYSAGDIDESLSIHKKDEEDQSTFFMIEFKKTLKGKTCKVILTPHTKKTVDAHKLHYFKECHAKTTKYMAAFQKILEMKKTIKEKEIAATEAENNILPKFNAKEFVKELMKLIDE